jgi:pyridoxal phosphate enzyme (YggS family)
MATLLDRYKAVQAQLQQAIIDGQRLATDVPLLAVSKTFPAEDIRTLYAAGQRLFGENYVQEFTEKTTDLSDLAIEWHFIGALQSNKTRMVAEKAHWVHTIDRLKIAQRLSDQRPNEMPTLNVCLEVNISDEPQKHGVSAEAVLDLAQAVQALPNIQLRGLMCIPSATDDIGILKKQFEKMNTLLSMLQQAGLSVDTLSMGMSADMALAVASGSTMVRVGSAIFGARSSKPTI